MHRRSSPPLDGLAVAGLFGALLAGCGSEAAAADRAARPDIVLVSIDSLRADHLGCYGYERDTSPVLDRLAETGVRFEEAYSTTSWTLPAHAAMFTGLHDSQHGVTHGRSRLADRHRTLAERLRDVGYRTAGFYGGPFLHPTFGLDQGFDTWVSCMGAAPAAVAEEDAHELVGAGGRETHRDVTGPRTAAAIEEWAASDPGRPFFLFVHLWDVHYDYLAPDEYVDLFDPGYEGALDGLDFESNEAIHRRMDERDLRHLIAMYDAEIRFTDDNLARILGALEARGLLDDALVVVTSDHGEEFFDHGGKGHQETLYDEVVRVPLIFHWPGRLAPRVVRQPVSLTSLAPTLLGVAGADASGASGPDLAPLFAGEELPPAPILTELLVDDRLYALRADGLKVFYQPAHGERVFAFDLERDPGERRPLAADDDPRVPLALARLKDLVVEAADDSLAELDPELEGRLRSLGYLDGERTPD